MSWGSEMSFEDGSSHPHTELLCQLGLATAVRKVRLMLPPVLLGEYHEILDTKVRNSEARDLRRDY